MGDRTCSRPYRRHGISDAEPTEGDKYRIGERIPICSRFGSVAGLAFCILSGVYSIAKKAFLKYIDAL